MSFWQPTNEERLIQHSKTCGKVGNLRFCAGVSKRTQRILAVLAANRNNRLLKTLLFIAMHIISNLKLAVPTRNEDYRGVTSVERMFVIQYMISIRAVNRTETCVRRFYLLKPRFRR